ncbi:Stabilin-1 [Frankliniella fusca]|uniref:Stabilin-1 n=1 Tax=Frankliniella fusca TaxID=407009 RepID=A0AAE1HVR2_9NEOP|nr:Stabilin-1 [Frankliniella fusca]
MSRAQRMYLSVLPSPRAASAAEYSRAGRGVVVEMISPAAIMFDLFRRWMIDRGATLAAAAAALESKPSSASPQELSAVRRHFWIPKREKKRAESQHVI